MDILVIYQRVILVANSFTENADILTIDILKDFDPSVEIIARNLRFLANIIKDIAGESYEDQDIALNAFQCCLIMEQIADAVAEEDDSKLDDLVKQLEVHTKVP